MRESDVGALKIVITKPGDENRPRTMEDVAPTKTPLLEIAIPSWKLGIPRFTLRGTPVFHGSSYAPTEELGSSKTSFTHPSPHYLSSSVAQQKPSPGLTTEAFLSPFSTQSNKSTGPNTTSPSQPIMRKTYVSTHIVIEPSMFDSLTFKPTCDERTIVRYAANTGAVTAATPPRLVSEITSPSFLDYELISDFFLTYRSFLEASDLLRMLIARLKWALARDDEIGMVVRVRTFVALRHWILNYFVDDFVIDYGLRVIFCNLLNDFVDELSQDARGRKVQLKILAELKKCWRRVCAQYWDGPEFESGLGLDIPIAPGGIAGDRDPGLDPSIWEQKSDRAPQVDFFAQRQSIRDASSLKLELMTMGAPADAAVIDNRPITPEPLDDELTRNQTSPISVMSVDAVSCSFPGKNARGAQPGTSPLGAHPVVANGLTSSTDPIATTPRALIGKRVRPDHPHTHKRNNSLTDSLRDHTPATEKVLYKNAEFLLGLPYAGSLVRGNVFPPSQPFVDIEPANIFGMPSRQTTIFQPFPNPPKNKASASAMSGQGMKKLLGSVRRALSTKGQGVSPTHGNFINISPIGPRGATTNRLPGTAIVPQARPIRVAGGRPPIRIDILGAEIAEDFKKAVREDAGAGTRSFISSTIGTITARDARRSKDPIDMSPAEIDSSYGFVNASGRDRNDNPMVLSNFHDNPRPFSDLAMTTGSKSIVIVDGTASLEVPAMTGALPALNPSVEAFADSFLRNGADPTPPNTPPAVDTSGTPRKSSILLGQHIFQPSLSDDPLPPFVPDLATLGGRPSEDASRPSLDHSRPPLSNAGRHNRQESGRTFKTNRSLSIRRYTSYHGAIVAHSSTRSFDATTYSKASIASVSDVPMPEPLRILRRRPGGDLKAARNVGDLDAASLRRSRSVGSLTAYSESIQSSFIQSPVLHTTFAEETSSCFSPDTNVRTFSLGAIAEGKKRPKSSSSAQSSQPALSLTTAVQELRELPDDTEDDGGVESALLKLEGRFPTRQRKPKVDSAARITLSITSNPSTNTPQPADGAHREIKAEHRHLHIANDVLSAPERALRDPPTNFLSVAHTKNSGQLGSFLSDGSQDSYNSIPLLKQNLASRDCDERITEEWTDMSILKGTENDALESVNNQYSDSITPFPSAKPANIVHPRAVANVSRNSEGQSMQSFLDVNDSDSDSQLSSELSMEADEYNEYALEFDALSPRRTVAAASKLPSHPLGESIPSSQCRQPPSPPVTLAQAPPDNAAKEPQLQDHQVWTQNPPPLTPDTTPTTAAYALPPLQSPVRSEIIKIDSRKEATPVTGGNLKFSAHLPFILAFDSDILAQQFTLIEKDALNEIDWRELIEMRWKDASNSDSRSWVDFLRNTDARGVEVVIARFNLMVKWTVSEIVLTQDVQERARCLIKFIHIAANCRRYRNFATMAQITIALASNEVARLSATWVLVPQQDIHTLHDLEALIRPTRNFYNLRAEMEGGRKKGSNDNGASAEVSCIPFVGIYTHDLLFNSQRPSEIASSPTTAPLVNFERCRVAAGIVKTLLRLLEASTLYKFKPIEGITERCLWMSALSDDDIRKYSEALEPPYSPANFHELQGTK